jgi:chromosomal replication initiator protein
MDLWTEVLGALSRRVNQHSIDTWFRPVVFSGCDNGTLRLTVPTEEFRKCLLDNYSDALRDALRETAHPSLKLDVAVQAAAEKPLPAQAPVPRTEPTNGSDGNLPLNPKYTFSSFVVGSSNQFAQAAALAVAEQPSRAYNPLYIYGGVGLGKTHLMHAIGPLTCPPSVS